MRHFVAIESLFSEYLLNICNVPGIWDLMIKGGTRSLCLYGRYIREGNTGIRQ